MKPEVAQGSPICIMTNMEEARDGPVAIAVAVLEILIESCLKK